MRRRIKKSLYFLSLLSSVFITPVAEAKMPVTAFKGITKFFRKGKEYMSPTLGEVALETGLIHDMRFYWNFTAGFKPDGSNEYMRDTSKDPLWLVLKDLMPSPAGAIAATVNNSINFGRFATPESVAIMLNYTNAIRNLPLVSPDQALKEIDRELARLKSEQGALESSDKPSNSKKKNKKGIKPRYTLEETKTKIKEYEANKQTLSVEVETINKLKTQLIENLLNSLDAKAIEAFLKEEYLNDSLKAELEKNQDYIKMNQSLEDAIRKTDISTIQSLKEQIEHLKIKILEDKQNENPDWGALNEAEFQKKKDKWARKYKVESLDNLAKHIYDALVNEKNSLAPQYTLEQVITAFFDEQFNDRADIKRLLERLDDDIIDKSQLSTFRVDDRIELNDLLELSTKKELEIDDIYALSNYESLTSGIVPYKRGDTPVGNGNANKYNRANNVLLTVSIADCVETTMRHISNLLLYNPHSKRFDLSHLKKSIKETNQFFKNFEEFYQLQAPDQANAGDITIRSAWNKVLADLNAFKDPINIRYMRGSNELDAGYINIIKAFHKLFNLEITPLPARETSYRAKYTEAELSWVKEGMEKILKAMNPSYSYRINLSPTSGSNDEVSGHMHISAQENNIELFSFDIDSQVSRHAKLSNINYIPSASEANFKNGMKKTPEDILRENTPQSLLQNSGGSLALQVKQIGPKFKRQQPIYQLFHKKLQDNNSRIQALGNIIYLYPRWQRDPVLKNHLNEINAVVSHILEQTSWNDPHIVEEISYNLMTLNKIGNSNLKDILATKVQCLSLLGLPMGFENQELLKTFKSLKRLSVWCVNQLNNDVMASLKQLEQLDIYSEDKIKVDLGNYESLKELNIRPGQGSSLRLKHMGALEKLSISNVDIQEPLSLEAFKSLKSLKCDNVTMKELNARNLENLETMSLKGSDVKHLELVGNKALEEVDLSESRFDTISMHNMQKLTSVKLVKTRVADDLSLSHLDSLKELELNKLSIRQLHLHDLKALRNLNLADTQTIRELSIEDLVELETLNLEDSAIQTLTLKGDFPKLQEMNMVNVSDDLKIEGLDTVQASKASAGQSINMIRNMDDIEFPSFNPDMFK